MNLREELLNRIERFKKNLTNIDKDWEVVAVFGKVNTFYFTNTMQNGVLVIKRDGGSFFFVRKSYERAKIESPLESSIILRASKIFCQ